MSQMNFESPSDAIYFAVKAVLEKWTALDLIIQHHAGAKSPAIAGLVHLTLSMALNTRCRFSVDDYTNMFYTHFDMMHTDVQDGSLEQVANHIVHIRDAASKGDFAPARRAIEMQGVSSGIVRNCIRDPRYGDSDIGNTSESQSASHGASSRRAPMDEDGFTEVQRR